MQDFDGRPGLERLGARDVKSVSGPIKVAGAYGFTLRNERADEHLGHDPGRVAREVPAARAESLPESKRPPLLHAVRPHGLRLQPGLPRVSRRRPTAGTARRPDATSSVYGVTGKAELLGLQTVKVPAGKFQAIVVRTTLKQNGLQVRQRHADDVVRAGQRPREARLPARRRQHVDGGAGGLVRRLLATAVLAAGLTLGAQAAQAASPAPSLSPDLGYAGTSTASARTSRCSPPRSRARRPTRRTIACSPSARPRTPAPRTTS